MGNKIGWGAARPGKVRTSDETVSNEYGEYKMTDVKSSKDLNGEYEKYQGNRQGTKGK